jgi:hypothetical protein
LDRAGLSDERRAKVGHDAVRLHQLLPEGARRIRIVFSVLIVLSERDSGVYLFGLADDVCFDTEPVERRERLSVKLGDGSGRQRHRLLITVALPNRKHVVDEVELHVEHRIPVWNCTGGQSPGTHIQGHLPPVIDQRHVDHADLADNLGPHMQGVAGGRPFVHHQARPVVGPRGALHVVPSHSSPSVRLITTL